MFQVFVRFKDESSEFALWPVMRDHRSKRVYIGTISEPYPTTFTVRNLGTAVARLHKNYNGIDRVEVRPAIDYDAIEQSNSGGSERGTPGYSEACGVYN